MKTKITIWLFLIGLIGFSQENDVLVAQGLLQRIAPRFTKQILFKKKSNKQLTDYYELKSENSKLIITANNANSMAVGLNYYLKNFCFTTVSWYAKDAILLPNKLPLVATPVRNNAKVKNRFFLNYCTFGYTMPWWQWNDWERLIDWMALNGINLPLAITGQEKIWLTVWKKFGLSEEQIRTYFTGPAYLPWHRMANIDQWEGPLPMSWIDHQEKLQNQILKREREFNMKPVLPAFAGHVPEAIKEKYPSAKITSLGEWGNFSPKYQSYFLDSFDPLFNQIQEAFLKEQNEVYGTDHIYGTDPFNEVTPPSWDADYLASASKNIYNSMARIDKEAQWLQMGWIFYFNQDHWTKERIKAYLQAVPQDKMILLDYFCDNTEIWKSTESFYNQPYIWCYLGNFGGNTILDGNLKDIDIKIDNTLKNGGKNLWGIGSTLEGFGINPIMFEFIFDKAWSNSTTYSNFAQNYAQTRVGKPDKNAAEAWKILADSIYINHSDIGKGDLTNSKPVFENHFNWTVNPDIKYNTKNLLKAWDLLLKSKADNALFNNDLIAVGKQVLGNHFIIIRNHFTEAYKNKDVNKMKEYGSAMLELIADIDELLASNPNTLVGKWISDAKAFARNDSEKKYYEQDARKIISVWGEKGHDLNDYANRSIAGLMKDYYGGRWKIFIDAAIQSAENQTNFNEKEVLQQVDEFSNDWSESTNYYSNQPIGNCREISKKLYLKYAKAINESN
jgi:alpha-N-acetylglucosaminidase